MPVLDHETHASTVDTGKLYGCANTPRSVGYFAIDREYFPDGRFRQINVWIDNVMSKLCRYDLSLADSKCATCTQRGSGEEYSVSVIAGNN